MKQTFYFFIFLFILTSCNKTTFDINQIDFKTDSCEGDCPIFAMTILYDGTANYNAEMFNMQQGNFKTKIKRPQLDSLVTLIQNLNIFKFKNNYSIPVTDHPTYTLTVNFKNGKVKTIEDYGPSGPKELDKVYDLIFSLRDSQEWK